MPICPDVIPLIKVAFSARLARPCRWVAVAAAAFSLAWPGAARAGCWFDPALTQQARQIAQRLMPELNTVPEVKVCTPEHFPTRVDGMFQGGSNQIEIHQASVASRNTADLLIHELAHALVFQQFGPQNFASGHGLQWMRLMVRLGRVDDARFHASIFPEAMPGFEQAIASVSARGGSWKDGSRPTVSVAAPTQVRSTLASAEADLRGLQCLRVLLVPPSGGMHGYALGANYRSFTPLPLGNERIRTIRWARPGVLELESLPTPDSSPSLLCLG